MEGAISSFNDIRVDDFIKAVNEYETLKS